MTCPTKEVKARCEHPARQAFAFALALLAFAFADVVSRTARWRRFDVRLTLPSLLRVDFLDGFPVAESSSLAPPLAAARLDTFRVPLRPPPTLRSLALTPGRDVSTSSSRRRFFGCFGLAGFASFCCCALNR